MLLYDWLIADDSFEQAGVGLARRGWMGGWVGGCEKGERESKAFFH